MRLSVIRVEAVEDIMHHKVILGAYDNCLARADSLISRQKFCTLYGLCVHILVGPLIKGVGAYRTKRDISSRFTEFNKKKSNNLTHFDAITMFR